MAEFTWSHYVFVVVSLITAPLYISILIIYVREWKRNVDQKTTLMLLISQGIADLVCSLNYFCFVSMRATKWLTPIYWNLQNYYIATWCFNQYYIATVLRTLGITLITTHRYMTMCQHGSVWERCSNSNYRWILVIVQWVFPFVYVMPALGRKLLFFDNEHGMNVVAGHDLITIGNVLAVGFLCPSFTVCLLCYMAILRFLYKHRLDNTISFKRELRVCVQMIGMVVAFALCTLYHVLLFKFSLSADLLLIFKTRQQYPLMTCFLSYISPWMMVVTSKDLRAKLLNFYNIRLDRHSPSPQLSRFREISNSKITPICISRR